MTDYQRRGLNAGKEPRPVGRPPLGSTGTPLERLLALWRSLGDGDRAEAMNRLGLRPDATTGIREGKP